MRLIERRRTRAESGQELVELMVVAVFAMVLAVIISVAVLSASEPTVVTLQVVPSSVAQSPGTTQVRISAQLNRSLIAGSLEVDLSFNGGPTIPLETTEQGDSLSFVQVLSIPTGGVAVITAELDNNGQVVLAQSKEITAAPG